jgi:DNA-binding CsgD family transcriptional regulator
VEGGAATSVGPSRMAGRVDERRAIEALVAAPSGDAATLVIEGAAGIGKSTLWEAAVTSVTDAIVLACAPTEAEASMPFAGLADLLGDIGADELAALPDPQQRALGAALFRVPPPPAGIEPLALGLACLGLLGVLAERAPVLLAIDDAQWLDPATTSAVAFALRRTGASPVAALLTVRSGLPIGPELEDALRSRRADRRVLGPLDLTELDAMIRLRLGRQLPLAALLQLQRASHGNPLHALEIARAAGDAVVELVPGEPLPVPSELADLLRSRLDRLSAPTRDGLVLLAEVVRPTRSLLVGAVGDGPAARCLEKATEANVLTGVGDRLTFTHPLLREVLAGDLTPPQRRAVHARLADLVEDPVEQGRHLAAATASEDLEVAAAVEDAARLADRRGAPVEAAALSAAALRLTGAGAVEALVRRSCDLAAHLARAGAFEPARDVLEGCVRRLLPGPSRVPLLLSLASVVGGPSEREAAHGYYEQAIDEARGDAAASARARQAFAWVLAATGEPHRAREVARKGVVDAEQVEDPRIVAGALATDGMVRFMLAEGPTHAAFERAVALDPEVRFEGVSGRSDEPSATFQAVNHAVWSDDVERARSGLAALRSWATERADLAALAHCDWLEMIVDLRQGAWADARARIRSLEREARWFGESWGTTPVMSWMCALVEAHLGGSEQAVRHAEEGIASAERTEHAFARIQCEGVLGFLELSRGDALAACERLAPLPGQLHELGYREPAFQRLTADAIEAAVAAGELALGTELLDRFSASAASSGNRWGQAAVLRCRGLLQAAAGERDRAADTLAAAVERHQALGQPFELGRTRLVEGALHRRCKRKAAAREALEHSGEILAALPAPLWQRRVEDELARLGGRPAAPSALTATETQVASLVAEGRTNHEVAAAMFVSSKTVEWNLSKVYRKLGVRSRSELAALWSPAGADDEG